MRYIPYVPQNIGELMDKIRSMMLGAPAFKDDTGYFPKMNIDGEFFGLNEGLIVCRNKIGENRYNQLKALSDKMCVLFEADPEDKTGDTRAGRKIIREMEDILRNTATHQG